MYGCRSPCAIPFSTYTRADTAHETDSSNLQPSLYYASLAASKYTSTTSPVRVRMALYLGLDIMSRFGFMEPLLFPGILSCLLKISLFGLGERLLSAGSSPSGFHGLDQRCVITAIRVKRVGSEFGVRPTGTCSLSVLLSQSAFHFSHRLRQENRHHIESSPNSSRLTGKPIVVVPVLRKIV